MNEQEKYDWMVYVSCMTFNQAQYIEDAMNGFTMQETNFPFVCAVVDDASTDGEPEVIRKYLLENFDLEDKSVVRHEETDDYVLTFARHKTNLNCYFAVLFLKYNHYSIKKSKVPYIAQWRDKAKYIALCEGDDYWIDNKKLQKQVDYLDNNPGCGLVYTNYQVLESNTIKDVSIDYKYENIEKLIVDAPFLAPCTWVYRNGIVPAKGYLDFTLLVLLSANNSIHHINDVTSVYRILKESVSHSPNPLARLKYRDRMIKAKLSLIDRLSLSDELRNECMFKSYTLSLLDAIKTKNQPLLIEAICFIEKVDYPLSLKQKIVLFIAKHKMFHFLIR